MSKLDMLNRQLEVRKDVWAGSKNSGIVSILTVFKARSLNEHI